MSDWIEAPLADLAQWYSGGTPNTSNNEYWGGDIPWISAASLRDFHITSSDRCVTTLGAASGTRLVPAGTTIFVVRGMSLMTEFRIGITKREVAFGQDCKALFPKPIIDPYFLAYAIQAQTPAILGMVDAAGHGTGRLQTDRISRLQVSLPADLDEQRATVAVLKTLDDKIAINDQIQCVSFDLAVAYYRRISFSVKTSVALAEILDLKYGKALPASLRLSGAVPVYGSGGVVGHHGEALVAGPGVIIGRKGTVGTVHWSEGDFFPIDTTFYVRLLRQEIPIEFAFFALRELGLESMNSDSAVPGLNRGNALALRVPLPGNDDLQSFYEEVYSGFALRDALSTESASLAELRDTLLPKLMSGEIRVRDAKRIVEDAT
ncbi:MAG TPA: restriction endonuclease subunit S [Streptosporangiaceae bacterium]|nr:restriction endonuclease subunit S [Streptosporangiaceae bacterium]